MSADKGNVNAKSLSPILAVSRRPPTTTNLVTIAETSEIFTTTAPAIMNPSPSTASSLSRSPLGGQRSSMSSSAETSSHSPSTPSQSFAKNAASLIFGHVERAFGCASVEESKQNIMGAELCNELADHRSHDSQLPPRVAVGPEMNAKSRTLSMDWGQVKDQSKTLSIKGLQTVGGEALAFELPKKEEVPYVFPRMEEVPYVFPPPRPKGEAPGLLGRRSSRIFKALSFRGSEDKQASEKLTRKESFISKGKRRRAHSAPTKPKPGLVEQSNSKMSINATLSRPAKPAPQTEHISQYTDLVKKFMKLIKRKSGLADQDEDEVPSIVVTNSTHRIQSNMTLAGNTSTLLRHHNRSFSAGAVRGSATNLHTSKAPSLSNTTGPYSSVDLPTQSSSMMPLERDGTLGKREHQQSASKALSIVCKPDSFEDQPHSPTFNRSPLVLTSLAIVVPRFVPPAEVRDPPIEKATISHRLLSPFLRK